MHIPTFVFIFILFQIIILLLLLYPKHVRKLLGSNLGCFMTSPNVKVFAPLKPERSLAKFSIYEESFIFLKAGSCNKYVVLPGPTNTLCT